MERSGTKRKHHLWRVDTVANFEVELICFHKFWDKRIKNEAVGFDLTRFSVMSQPLEPYDFSGLYTSDGVW